MAHVRKQIRAAIVARLSGATAAGANVFANRTAPLQDDQLPAIVMETGNEDVSALTVLDPPVYGRTLVVDVVIKAKPLADLDDVLDDIAEQVEPLMVLLPSLPQLQPTLTATEFAPDGGQERPLGTLRLTYQIQYQTTAADPATET